MKLVKNYFYNAFYQIFVLIVPLITTPYLARVLGPEGVGVNAYTSSIVQYFILLGSLGIGLYANRQIAFIRESKEELSKTFFEIFIVRILTMLISLILFMVFLCLVKQYKTYYLVQSITVLAVAFDISWFFMGLEKFSITVMRNIVVKIITVICIFLFVKTSNDLINYVLILSISTLIGNLLLFPNLMNIIEWPKFKQLNPLRHVWPSLILFVPQIATQVYLVLNKTMLGSLVSVQSAGYFDQSDKIIKVVLAVVTATGTVMLPRVANTFAKGDHVRTKQYLYDSFSFVTAISIPMSLGLAAITSKLVPLFLSPKFNEVIPIMLVESIVIVLIAWSNAIGTQYLLPTKQTKSFTVSVVVGAVVNLIANIPLILLLGALGAAIATVLSEIAVTGYQLFSVRKQIEFKKLFTDGYKYFIAGIAMFVLIVFLNQLLKQTWLSLFMEIIIGSLFYVGLLVLLRAKIIIQAKILLKTTRKKS
ncbi:oligosaccharide flippase family protein [Companilactobacillus mishanensis]|uniref:oligosaccharide flippase family protein n=1 Tax=Companilactobacillus mishanensis TaxID=2486008 RepID=UPI001297CCD0|nr:oligosaccharide flippase family protein [Companilactobacillus mishanensis]MQS88858.1 polysaccharide biosynthesis protein [Companilactobacillus mishanensis]